MKTLIATISILALTGCAVGGVTGDGFTMSGSSEGIRAYFDGMNGIVTNTKTTDPEGRSAHWEMRAVQEQEATKRKCSNCGFLGKLMGRGEAQK